MRNTLRTANLINVCYALVSGYFATFVDKSSQGESFKWSKFPEMTERYVATNLFMYFPDEKKPTQKEVEMAKREAGVIARHLVLLANLEGE